MLGVTFDFLKPIVLAFASPLPGTNHFVKPSRQITLSQLIILWTFDGTKRDAISVPDSKKKAVLAFVGRTHVNCIGLRLGEVTARQESLGPVKVFEVVAVRTSRIASSSLVSIARSFSRLSILVRARHWFRSEGKKKLFSLSQ